MTTNPKSTTSMMLTSAMRVGNARRLTEYTPDVTDKYRYDAVVDLEQLGGFLDRGFISYAPKYQRGLISIDGDPELPEHLRDKLLPIHHPNLDLKTYRAEAIAGKYLLGELKNRTLMWNIRPTKKGPGLVFETAAGDIPLNNGEEAGTLNIDGAITIPDTGHRHYALYKVFQWLEDDDAIPEKLNLLDGRILDRDTLLGLINKARTVRHAFKVTIFNEGLAGEGLIFAEINLEQQKAERGVGIGLAMDKTPERRFIADVIANSKALPEKEIEMQRSRISARSRKLATLSNLTDSAKVKARDILKLEADPAKYTDMVTFVAAFIDEYAAHFPEFNAAASTDQRISSRESSLVVQNITMSAIIALAIEFGLQYQAKNLDWKSHSAWKAALGKIAGKQPGHPTVKVLDRQNPELLGQVVITKPGQTTPTINNTRGSKAFLHNFFKDLTKSDFESI